MGFLGDARAQSEVCRQLLLPVILVEYAPLPPLCSQSDGEYREILEDVSTECSKYGRLTQVQVRT
jgi:hypothetical protein